MFSREIDYADCEPSDALTKQIEERLEKLEKFYDRITSAHVTVRIPHKHATKRFYHIHVQLDVPGKTIVVNRETERNIAHTDPTAAVRDAFDKVTRQLEDFVKHRREGTKSYDA